MASSPNPSLDLSSKSKGALQRLLRYELPGFKILANKGTLRRLLRYELPSLGILAAIVLVPTFWNQGQPLCACADGKSQALTYVGSMNRAQQAYRIENNSFSDRFDALGVNFTSETAAYQYSITLRQDNPTTIAAFHFGQSRSPELPSYVGGVFDNSAASDRTTSVILCETTAPSQAIAPPIDANTCAPGSTKIR